MTFEDVWRQVRGLPDTAKLQVPGALQCYVEKTGGAYTSINRIACGRSDRGSKEETITRQ